MSKEYKDSLYNVLLGKDKVRFGTQADLMHKNSYAEKNASASDPMVTTYGGSFSKLKINTPMLSFNFIDIDGNEWRSEDLHGKIVVLNTWFVNCAPCVKEMPELNRLAKEFSGKEIVFFAINPMDHRKEVEIFMKENPFNYNQILGDGAKAFVSKVGIAIFPTNIVIDKDGQIQYISYGFTRNVIGNIQKSIEKFLN